MIFVKTWLRYDFTHKNGLPERPLTLRKPETINDFSAGYAQSKCGAHSKSSHIKRLLHKILYSSLK